MSGKKNDDTSVESFGLLQAQSWSSLICFKQPHTLCCFELQGPCCRCCPDNAHFLLVNVEAIETAKFKGLSGCNVVYSCAPHRSF